MYSKLVVQNDSKTIERVHPNNRFWNSAGSLVGLTSGLHKWSIKINNGINIINYSLASVNIIVGITTNPSKIL
jgi:hypothetical protein